MKKRIYISGPISGLDKEECIKRFDEIEKMLSDDGFRVFNPLKNGLPFDADTHSHMRRDLNILTNEEDPFDYIFMMKRWTHSAGCYKEFENAIACGISVIFEELSFRDGARRYTHCYTKHGYAAIKFE